MIRSCSIDGVKRTLGGDLCASSLVVVRPKLGTCSVVFLAIVTPRSLFSNKVLGSRVNTSL